MCAEEPDLIVGIDKVAVGDGNEKKNLEVKTKEFI
jgi:hypothetical protein